jgi:outer membrane autotransporter protein
MKLNSGYEFLRASPLASAVILALGCSSSAWSADLGPGESAVVDSTSPVENWNLINALLDVELQGATGAINAAYGSALNISGGSASASGIAVNLLNSDAEISGATLTSTRTTGLAVNRNGDFIDPASTAFVSDSTISGVGRGVVVSFESTLQLARTTVTGALNQNGAGTGILMLDGAVSLEDNTRVTGQVNGIQMASEVLPTPADVGILTIDASSVTGTTGSAILVAPLNAGGRPSNAQINISNASTLQGGNGLAIEVNRASSAQVQVQGSTLLGGILVDATSSADVVLDEGSTLTGDVTNVANFTLNNQSAMTGNLTATDVLTVSNNSSITGDVSQVQTFSLAGNSLVQGNLTNVAEFTMNRSSMTGNLTGTTALTARDNSQIVGDVSDVQNFILSENSLVDGNMTNVAEFTMNRSSMTGNLTGTTALTASNNSQIIGNVSEVQNFLTEDSLVEGNLTNVAEFTLNRSSMTGNLSGTRVLTASDNVRMTGDVSDVQTFTMADASSMVGNLTNVDVFALSNGSSMVGNLTGTRALTASDDSSVTGNVSDVQLFTLAGNSSVAGNLKNVDTLSLDNSSWTTGDGQGVTHLTMNAGTVKLGSSDGTFETLNVSSLSGSGRFIIDTDLAARQSDLISVSGEATGSYDLQIRNTGEEPLKGGPDQQVVHTGAGSTAGFSVIGGQVDFGTFAYQLEQRANGADTDWYLVQTFDDEGKPITTPGTRSVIGLFSAAPTVWYGELTTLRSRMGELRYGKTEGGVWSRAYGNKYNLSAAGGTDYQQTQHGITFGADLPLPASDGQWLIGVLGGYSRSDLNIAAGTTGQVDSYYLGAYTTWLSDSGYYVDAVVKANRFKNKADVRMSDGGKSKGDYNTSGIGASVEAGKHIKLRDDWFVEPFAQLSTLWVQGKNYSLNNGMDASSNQADSILGKLGTTVGRNFPLDKGGYVQPYVKAALAHEFANSNRVKVNDTTFSNDLSGGRGELGAGVAAQLSDVLQLHADVDYSNGKNIEQPWGVNVGLRYSW